MPWLILPVAVPVVIKIVIAGADPGFFLGGGAPLRNDVTDRWGKQIFKEDFISVGVHTPCTLPLDPPGRGIPKI